MAAHQSRLWNEVRKAAPLAIPWRVCNEAWAISKDLGKITSDLCLSCSKAFTGYLTGPLQGLGLTSGAAFDQQLARRQAGWGATIFASPEGVGWAHDEDPLASGWDDVVRRPTAPLADPLLAMERAAMPGPPATTA